jgi:class 3 adenylate cyclase
MGADEEGTLERLKALRHELVDPKIAQHRGRIPGSSPGTKTTGDGMLVEFASVVDAVRCAVAVQLVKSKYYCGLSQFSRRRPSIRANSPSLSVTTV